MNLGALLKGVLEAVLVIEIYFLAVYWTSNIPIRSSAHRVADISQPLVRLHEIYTNRLYWQA